MHIKWFGQGCCKIQNKNITLLFDPLSLSNTGIKTPKIKDGIILHSTVQESFPQKDDKGNFCIFTPGEYEVKDVFIYALPSSKKESDKIIYRIELEDISLIHLGGVKNKPSEEIIGEIDGGDILMVPVGGKDVLSYEQAADLVSQIEPKIVIPIYYRIPNLKIKLDGVEKFSKELGVKRTTLDKLNIRKKDLPEETELIILNP